jgi:hypothetical protein
MGVQPDRVGVPDQPVGGRPQVLDLGVEVALTAGGRLRWIGQQRRVVLGVTLAGGLLVGRIGG